MAIKFNIDPYYDDFEVNTDIDGLSPKEKYYRILFRPGHAVQARELTQIQSILQNQVASVGKHLFEEGAIVVPGHATLDSKIDYVKLSSINSSNLEDLLDKTFVGADTGLEAQVVAVAAAEGLDPDTIFVKYQNSGTSGEKVFDDGETITADSFSGVVDSNGTGFGSVAFIDDGIYFINNHFVIVKRDQLILDKYDTNPSYDIGLEVVESIQTSAGDESLNDNANGTPNYAAPGAHRLQIKTTLVKQDVNGTDVDNFLLLIRVEEGRITKQVRATDYSVLEETLARRTFDESGNYTVRPFIANVREHTDVNNPGNTAKLAVGLEPGKAYVRGYEIETLDTEYVDIDKARTEADIAFFESASVPMLVGNYIEVENVVSIPDTVQFQTVLLRNASNATIGFCRVRSMVREAANNTFRLYLFDIRMNTGNNFSEVTNVYQAATQGQVAFTADLVSTTLFEPNRNTMVFPMPFKRVQSTSSDGTTVEDTYNYVYFANRDMGIDTVDSGEVSFSTLSEKEQFEPYDDENWVLMDTTDGSFVTLSSGQVSIQPNVNGAYTDVTISGLGAYEDNPLRLIAGVKRSFIHKMKSLTTDGQPNVDLFPVTSPTDVINLGEADGYKLRAVYMSADMSTGATINDEDVSEYYDFDTGQTDNFYGPAKIRRKSSSAFQPTGQLLVKYEYFTHDDDGDFFTLESYRGLTDSEGETVDYEDIPFFVSKNTGQLLELRSCVDFRPRMDDSGGNFVGTGRSLTVCPEPLTTFTTDVRYYLNRYDKIYMDKDGQFGVVKGVPAVSPNLPEDPKDAMVLYTVYVPGYTLSTDEVELTLIDNKRYTMRDIGRLDKRINALEYYTSLSLLEKEAADKQIVDPDTQIARLKSGFLVDSFASHNIGAVTNKEYRASIDRQNRQLRPMFSEDNVRLMFNNTLSTNVTKTGDLITLPYIETQLAYQQQASNWINVNPFNVFSWTGSLELSPTSDEWKDTTRRPQVIIDQEGVFDAMQSIIDATDAVGTVWNEWQTNWSGTNTNTSTNRQGRKITTTTTTTVRSGQSRTGIETFVVPDSITTNIGDRVVEVNFAPYIRSRIVTFKATRMKPNTQVYAFFDGIDVSNFVRQESTYQKYTELDNPVLNGANNVNAHPVGATTLTTNENGELYGSFFIPNNNNRSFKTGTRVFKLTDDSGNNETTTTTSASASYSAKGLIETKENVTISTRIPRIEQREVANNRIITSTNTRTSVRWVDPLAQSFIVDLQGGGFITSIDLFFHTKSSTIPVTLQIREMDQGIPTQRIVPFAEVTLNPADVNVIDLETNLPDPDQATNFKFDSPVYLQDGQEYCFVVLANSPDYNLWYAGIGEDAYLTGERISKQPYAGVLFKSQNASTWTPDQNKDLKFKINRAQFDDSAVGRVMLENGSVQPRQLVNNPFGTTSGSSEVRVSHKNHHMFIEVNGIASYVTIAGSTDVNGIPAATMNGTHQIISTEMDSYVIDVGVNATGTGIDGGSNVTATENQLYHTYSTYVQNVILPNTNAYWESKTSTGLSLSDGIVEGDNVTSPYVTNSAFSSVILNENVTMQNAGVIASDDNEQSGRTFFLRGTLSTTRDNLSPVIDLERASVYTIANRIDKPSATDQLGYNTVANYVAETDSSDGSALAKYLTKSVQLAEEADGIRLFLDVNRPSKTEVEVYIKSASSEEAIEDLEWTLAAPSQPIPSDDSSNYTEVEYVIDPDGTFTVFQLKIVMLSSNAARVPTIKDLRAIALLP